MAACVNQTLLAQAGVAVTRFIFAASRCWKDTAPSCAAMRTLKYKKNRSYTNCINMLPI